MKTEDRLKAALDAKAEAVHTSPSAYAGVQERITRRRILGRLQVAGAAIATAAVVVGAVAVVQSTDEATAPAPIGQPSATITAAPPTAPSSPAASDPPSTSPSAGPEGTLPGGVPVEDYVAILSDGRLVTASARTGEITVVLTTVPRETESPRFPGDLAISPDRKRVYYAASSDLPVEPEVGEPGTEGESCMRRLHELDVTTGEVTPLSIGSHPQISPDGRSLAFERGCGEESLVVRDIASGDESAYANIENGAGATSEGPWVLADLVWHADSKRIWVVMDWEDAPELRLLDPAKDSTLRDADDVATRHLPFGVERRGDGLAFLHMCCYPEQLEDGVIYLRDAAGNEREVVRSPASGRLTGLLVGPDGDLMYVQGNTLYRLDPDTGETLELGKNTALARDW